MRREPPVDHGRPATNRSSAQSDIGGIIGARRTLKAAAWTLAGLLTVAWIAACLALIAIVPMPSDAATPQARQGKQPVLPVGRRCKTVTPQVHNKRVKLLDQITGKRHHKASRKVCKSHYRELGQKVKQARKTCKARALTVTASVFGGRGDDNGIGYRGDRLFNFNDSFAELGMGRALGGLPLHAKRWINYRSKTVRGTKRDIGGGGAGIGGTVRAIDLHAPLASRLNFPWGIGIVRVSANNCWAR